MGSEAAKRLVLLDAYEELTRKESLCLREENYDALLRIQKKKAKLAEGLEASRAQALTAEEESDFQVRLRALMEVEDRNAKVLATQMRENRDLFKLLNRTNKSGSKAVKAYGKQGKQAPSSSSLRGKV